MIVDDDDTRETGQRVDEFADAVGVVGFGKKDGNDRSDVGERHTLRFVGGQRMDRAGVERIMRFAFGLARSRPRKLLTVVTKSNAQRHAMVMWDEIAAEIRRRWPDTGRIAILHRLGTMSVTVSTVIVAVSSPHRPEAFEAARFGIDALKAGAPIWKHEVWSDGADWGTGATPPRDVSTLPSMPTGN